jgi:DNA invertase Pin-like site-specific DNA recombinase
VGYARVSTNDQKLDLQNDALAKAGCDRKFHDVITGSKAERPGLKDLLHFVRAGDSVVVWKLDRLGRSLQDLISIVNDLEKRGIGFKSLQESIDTTTPGGRLVFHIFGALAEFERGIIRERTNAGIAAARARGRLGGRKQKLTGKKLEMAMSMMADKNNRVCDIAEIYGVHRSLLYRMYRERQNGTAPAKAVRRKE